MMWTPSGYSFLPDNIHALQEQLNEENDRRD